MHSPRSVDLFRSADLGIAATAICNALVLQGIDRDSSGRGIFLFERSELLDSLIQQYWARQIQIEPIAFQGALRELKSRLREQQ